MILIISYILEILILCVLNDLDQIFKYIYVNICFIKFVHNLLKVSMVWF